MVRAAHGRSAISTSRYFLLADYLYQHPSILVKIFVGLDIFVSVAHKLRGEISMMDKLFPGSQHGL